MQALAGKPNQNTDLRYLARNDLYFLIRYVLGRADMEREWLFQRCREVQQEPDSHLDLWAREHYKSTILTFGLTIQDVIKSHGEGAKGREVSVGIFSHTRPNAKGFLKQIKREFEGNLTLRGLFPDIFWENVKEAPQWSEDGGLVVKRQGNPKEATIEAWGVVDGQPTGKHFTHLIYDDIVTRESVTSPEMIEKTTDALALSYNLGAHGGVMRFIGTRYHFADTYREIISRGTVKARIYPATEDGTVEGEPVFLDAETLARKRRDMGPYVFSCQMLQNPIADEMQGFRTEWLRYYEGDASKGTNRYILVDAANGKRKNNDFTAMWVLGLGKDQNYYILDIVRDRMNLTQRCAALMDLHRRWGPIEQVRYEQIGMMADIAHIQSEMARDNYRFDITQVGGTVAKVDRIKRLVPLFEKGRFYFPRTLHYTDYTGNVRDMVRTFIEEEYKAFPVPVHDDLLDSLARIEEPDVPLKWPKLAESRQTTSNLQPIGAGWMG